MNVNNTSTSFLPDDVLVSIAPHLCTRDCASMAKVCKQWGLIFTEICDERLYDTCVFDEKKWLQFQGVNSVNNGNTYEVNPELKKDYLKRLKSPCDIFHEKDPIQAHKFEQRKSILFCDTRRVILIPEMINGELVNINRIAQIFGFPKANNTETGLYPTPGNEKDEYRTKVAERTHFVEVSLDLIPGSRLTKHERKEIMLKRKGYRAPSPLEAVISIIVLNLGKENEFFFGKEGKHQTLTATDALLNERFRLVFGAVSLGVLEEECMNVPNYNVGVMAAAEVLLGHES